jgi:hypothetical protein
MYGEDLEPGDGQPAMDSYLLRIPSGSRVDGAVVELASVDRRLVNAEIRIPAPQPQRM